MNYKDIIVVRLLDKYEKSLHIKGTGLSNRRVLLKTERSELPEYDYHTDHVRDEFNKAVAELEAAGIVFKEWGRKDYVISGIWLNLENVEFAYASISRETPERKCERYILLISRLKEQCKAQWIHCFVDEQISEIQRTGRLSTFLKRDSNEIHDFFTALRGYDELHGDSISMRAFSIKCFQDSKYFERNVKDTFLLVAARFFPSLSAHEDVAGLSWRDRLMMMGVFARPELFELSGDIGITLKSGNADLSAFGVFGIAIPDTVISDILEIRMEQIRRVIFIENKTCYDEYLINHKQRDELVFYQGGFISSKKARFIKLIEHFARDGVGFFFWGDIDIGGFRMFYQLQEHICGLQPWKMGATEVRRYRHTGLTRSDEYLYELGELYKNPRFSLFYEAIQEILRYRVTIEQESILETLAATHFK